MVLPKLITRNWTQVAAHYAYVSGMIVSFLVLTMTIAPDMFGAFCVVIAIAMYLDDCLMLVSQNEFIIT